MALSETLKDLTEGISSLRNQTYKLGDRYMQGEDIMKDGMDLRNMLKNMDIEITKLEGTSRKDNPSVYDVEVEQYTSDEAGKLKNRLGELMNATSDFDEAPGMFDGGMLTGVIGGPVDVEKLDESRTVPGIIKETYSDPMLRLISGQRAGFYPQLGFGADPYENVFKRALGIPVAEAPTTPPPDRPPYIPPPDGPPFKDPRDGDFYDPRDDYLRDRFLDFRDADLFDFTPIGAPDTPKVPMDFDPAAFREDILSNIPAYDPSELEKGIASLQEQIGSFKPPTLDIGQITRDIQSQLKLPQTPQIDREALVRDIQSSIKIPQAPQIDIEALRSDILRSVPQQQLPDVSKFVTQSDINKALANIPQPEQLDRQALIRDIQSQLKIPERFDPTGLQQQIAANKALLESLPQPEPLDRQALIRDIQSQIKVPERFDPTGLQSQISGLQSQIQGIPQFDPTSLQARLGGLEQQLANIPQPQQIDVGALRQDILSRVPQFDPSSIQQGLASLESRLQNIPQVTPRSDAEIQSLINRSISNIPTPQTPDVSRFITADDLSRGLASINIPQVNLDPITSRLAQLEKQLAGLSTPSVSIPNFRNFTLG